MNQKWNIENEIILSLLRNKHIHLRALSKSLKCPLSTLHRQVERLKQHNIIRYESIGRNKEISLNKAMESTYKIYQAELYKASVFIERNPEFSILFEKILNKIDAGIIILFGSYAKGMNKKDSDIDIFIETDDRNARRLAESIDSRINAKIGKLDKSTPLGREIINDHIMIRGVELFYEKNPVFD